MKAFLRRTVLEYLVFRPAAAFPASAIARMVNLQRLLDENTDATAVTEALLYLEGLGYVRAFHSEMGGEKNWQATTAGIQYHERGEA